MHCWPSPLRRYRELLKRAVTEGHELGNHLQFDAWRSAAATKILLKEFPRTQVGVSENGVRPERNIFYSEKHCCALILRYHIFGQPHILEVSIQQIRR